MPIYEYCCPGCDNKFDLLRSFSQADEAVLCPECNQEARRLVSAFASFSKDAGSGVSTPIGGSSSCSSCASSSCSTCGS